MTVGHVLWPDQLDATERAALSPGTPTSLNRQPDVLVIGGGIVGVATAHACASARTGSVVLLERATLGSGASGGAAGQLLPESHVGNDPPELVDLGRLSLRDWRDLEQALPEGVGLLDLDWLAFGASAERLLDLPTLPARMQRLSTEDVRALVPDALAPAPGVRVQGEARVNPLRAIARLVRALPPTAQVATGIEVNGVTQRNGKITSVRTTVGDFSPGSVVFATGLAPSLDGLELDLPSHEVKGHIVVSEPTAHRLPGVVDPLATSLDDGRLLIGGSLDIGDTERVVRPEILQSEWAELLAGWPVVKDVKIEYGWACFRPAHADLLPVIDRVPGTNNAWLTSGHYRTGILMAPATANALAAWLLSGEPPAHVRPFSAARLLIAR